MTLAEQIVPHVRSGLPFGPWNVRGKVRIGIDANGERARSSVHTAKGTNTMPTVRLAVLGLNQGLKIARDAKENPEIDLVAVAGFGEKAEEAAAELGVPRWDDYVRLLEENELDAVAIALPNNLHLPAVEASLDNGITNILLEKPIANTVEDAEKIIELCRNANAKLLIGHHRRSSNRYLFLRQLIDSGRLGKIIGIQSTYAIAKNRDYFDMEWRVTKGGGPLLLSLIHI